MYIAPKFWLGNDSSAEHFVAAMSQYQKVEAAGGFKAYASFGREDLGLPSLLSVQDGVGVITISGGIVSGSSGFGAMFGVLGYDDIREALVEAVVDTEVKSIMLHISSGGGMVDGCEDFCSFLSQVATYKPLTTYADGIMASAAYWIGSSAEHISSNQTSLVGSLGVVMVHLDRSAMLAQDGIKATVVRSGKYKMLANSVEPLSPDALEKMQGQADTIYGVFISAVSANRKVSYEVANKQMGQGKEFLGKAALESGLIDDLMTYDQALSYAKTLDRTKLVRNNLQKPTGAMAMKVTLNTAQLAALAAGATTAMLGIDPTAQITNMPVPPAMATISVDDLAALNSNLAAATQTATTAQADLVNARAAFATSQVNVVAAMAQASAAEVAQAAAVAQVESMLPLVRDAVASMSAALGTTLDTAKLSATEALAKHAELAEPFNKRFPGGRLSAVAGLPTDSSAVASNLTYLNLIKSGPKASTK